jgi:hypothetical protein
METESAETLTTSCRIGFFRVEAGDRGRPNGSCLLGSWGDDGLAEVGAPFQLAAHWQSVITEYVRSVVPMDLFEYRIECGAATDAVADSATQK